MPPVITSISPAQGSERGGTLVLIRGSGFSTGGQLLATVRFGVSPAVTSNVDSDTQISALSPAGTGAVNVVVATLFEVSASDDASLFTFTKPLPGAPEITGIAPTAGPLAGGADVDITGNGLLGTTVVNFGPKVVLDPFIVDDTHIVVTAPPLGEDFGPGTVHISVRTPEGSSPATGADEFLYVAPPTVIEISPNVGDPAGGEAVQLTGTNLAEVTQVWFGENQAFGIAPIGDTGLSVFTPEGTAGPVDVIVVSPGGVSGTSDNARFLYSGEGGVPVVADVVPPIGDLGNSVVAILGSGLSDIAAVWFGGVPATDLENIDDSQLRVTTPAAVEPARVDVIVQSAAGFFSLRTENAVFDYLTEDDYLAQAGGPGGGGGTGTNVLTILVQQRYTIDHKPTVRARGTNVVDGVVLTFEPGAGGDPIEATVTGGQGRATVQLPDGSYFVTLSAAAIDRQAAAPAGPDLGTTSANDLYLDLSFSVTISNGQIDAQFPPQVESGVVHGDVFRTNASNLLVDWKPSWVQAAGARDRTKVLQAIVMHRTDGTPIPGIETFKSKRSAHYLIDVDGHVVKFAMERHETNHASSQTYWDGIIDLNESAIGIEMVNKINTAFPAPQVEAAKNLVSALLAGFDLSRHHVAGHGEVLVNSITTDRTLSFARRFDPGQEFGWPELEAASACTGLVPLDDVDVQNMYSGYFAEFPSLVSGDDDADKANRRSSSNPTTAARAQFIFDNDVVSQVQVHLHFLGYTINRNDFETPTGVMDTTTLQTIDRFKRRYYSGSRQKPVSQSTIVFDAADAATLLAAVKDRGLP